MISPVLRWSLDQSGGPTKENLRSHDMQHLFIPKKVKFKQFSRNAIKPFTNIFLKNNDLSELRVLSNNIFIHIRVLSCSFKLKCTEIFLNLFSWISLNLLRSDTYTEGREPRAQWKGLLALGDGPGGCRAWPGGRTGIWWSPRLTCRGRPRSISPRGRGSQGRPPWFAGTRASGDPASAEIKTNWKIYRLFLTLALKVPCHLSYAYLPFKAFKCFETEWNNSQVYKTLSIYCEFGAYLGS